MRVTSFLMAGISTILLASAVGCERSREPASQVPVSIVNVQSVLADWKKAGASVAKQLSPNSFSLSYRGKAFSIGSDMTKGEMLVITHQDDNLFSGDKANIWFYLPLQPNDSKRQQAQKEIEAFLTQSLLPDESIRKGAKDFVAQQFKNLSAESASDKKIFKQGIYEVSLMTSQPRPSQFLVSLDIAIGKEK